MREVNSGSQAIGEIVLCDGLGLDEILVKDGRATIGAAATMAAVAAHPGLAFLRPVAGAIGGPAVRSMATVGGNLFAPYPHGDFTVALLALGASVTYSDVKRTATVDLDRFLAGPQTAGRVVRAVGFELPPDGAFRFVKVTRKKPHGASVLSIAAVLPGLPQAVAGGRVAYGALATRPMRARAVEKALNGKLLDAATIAAAVKAAARGTAPLTDPQASAWYRQSVLPIHLKRLLEG
jgi:CO/xanthine dehydrogenase FAD-binding subunit